MGATFRGFEYDPGDPSVGIFGDLWAHVECREDDGEVLHVDQRFLATTRVNDLTTRTWYLLTCEDCGTQVIVAADDYDPTPEAEAEEEAARRRWEELV